MAIVWDPNLATGVAAIDEQHRELFARIDRLLESAQRRTSAAEVGALLEFLTEYVAEHFRTEEELMDATRYPHVAEHKAEHLAFARELVGLRAEHTRDGGTALLVVRVADRAMQWLRSHIYRTDKLLGSYLRERTR